jgi:hypothetical protein
MVAPFMMSCQARSTSILASYRSLCRGATLRGADGAGTPAAATGVTGTGIFTGGIFGPLGFGAVIERYSYLHAWLGATATVVAAAVLFTVGGGWLRRRLAAMPHAA